MHNETDELFPPRKDLLSLGDIAAMSLERHSSVEEYL